MFYPNSLQDNLIVNFVKLICDHTGMHIREQDRKALVAKLEGRVKALKLPNLESYYQFLQDNTEASSQEWRQLPLVLTTNETYFFRDAGQVSLLRNCLLPKLIEAKRKESPHRPSLRLWSAGCSTGEEPYSLAILVKQLIPDWEKWDIFILGTDINIQALDKAKEGLYNAWSFRLVNPLQQNQNFQPVKSDWRIDEKIKRMVTFQHGNLVKDVFPNTIIDHMDLILCRNVFVYFDAKSIAKVLEKFHRTLSPGGYLVTGHTELYGQDLKSYKAILFPESVVYQRAETLVEVNFPTATSPTSFATAPVEQNNPWTAAASSFSGASIESIANLSEIKLPQIDSPAKTEPKPEEVLQQAKTLFERKAYTEALKKAEAVLLIQPNNFGAYYLMAQVYANLGNYQQAKYYSDRAISINSFSELPYYILANIAEEQGNLEEAKALFKKIIYLAPKSICAYLELGSLYEADSDITRCLKMRRTALELLKQLPENAKVEQLEEITAKDVIQQVEFLLNSHQ